MDCQLNKRLRTPARPKTVRHKMHRKITDKSRPYLTENTLQLHYENHLINAGWRNGRVSSVESIKIVRDIYKMVVKKG